MLSFALATGLAVPVAAATTTSSSERTGVHQGQSQKPKPKPKKAKKAKKPKKAQARQDDGVRERRGDRDDRVFDRDGHVRVIRDHARRGLPPGLAKRESLPPGLRRQLRERGTLPPGLEKRLVDVPRDWRDDLPRVGRDYRRYFAGDDLIVVDTRTNRIVAYVPDVLRLR